MLTVDIASILPFGSFNDGPQVFITPTSKESSIRDVEAPESWHLNGKLYRPNTCYKVVVKAFLWTGPIAWRITTLRDVCNELHPLVKQWSSFPANAKQHLTEWQNTKQHLKGSYFTGNDRRILNYKEHGKKYSLKARYGDAHLQSSNYSGG